MHELQYIFAGPIRKVALWKAFKISYLDVRRTLRPTIAMIGFSGKKELWYILVFFFHGAECTALNLDWTRLGGRALSLEIPAVPQTLSHFLCKQLNHNLKGTFADSVKLSKRVFWCCLPYYLERLPVVDGIDLKKGYKLQKNIAF